MKAVLFDLDGTLVDRRASLAPLVREQYERFFAASAPVDFVAFRDHYFELDGCGFTPREQVYQTLVDVYGSKATVEELAADFRSNIGRHSVTFPGTLDVLRALRADGYALGIVTNGSSEAQSGKIRACGLDSLVDAILISAQEGVKKPDPVIFRRAAERLHVEPPDCLFIGDHPVLDVAGAQAVGMTAFWIRGCLPWPTDMASAPDDTIDQIEELLPIVRDWRT